MGWTLYQRPAVNFGERVPDDVVSLRRSGVAMVHRDALNLIRVTDRVVILVDAESWRIAIRKPRDGEEAQTFSVHAPKGKSGKRCGIQVAGALRQLEVTDLKHVAGRITIITRDDLLIIPLDRPTAQELKPRADDHRDGKPKKH